MTAPQRREQCRASRARSAPAAYPFARCPDGERVRSGYGLGGKCAKACRRAFRGGRERVGRATGFVGARTGSVGRATGRRWRAYGIGVGGVGDRVGRGAESVRRATGVGWAIHVHRWARRAERVGGRTRARWSRARARARATSPPHRGRSAVGALVAIRGARARGVRCPRPRGVRAHLRGGDRRSLPRLGAPLHRPSTPLPRPTRRWRSASQNRATQKPTYLQQYGSLSVPEPRPATVHVPGPVAVRTPLRTGQ